MINTLPYKQKFGIAVDFKSAYSFRLHLIAFQEILLVNLHIFHANSS